MPTLSTEEFEKLHRNYKEDVEDTVAWFISSNLPLFNFHEVADLTVDIFLKAYDAWKHFRGESSHKTYLLGIAKWFLFGERRKRRLRLLWCNSPGSAKPLKVPFSKKAQQCKDWFGNLYSDASKSQKRTAHGGSWRLPTDYQEALVSSVRELCTKQNIEFRHCKHDVANRK